MALPRQCEACGSPLASDQRYCLVCGTRVGARSTQLESLLSRVRAGGADRGRPLAAPGAAAAVPGPPPPPRLPGPWVSALLVLVFLAFGAAVGHVSSHSARLAASAAPLKLLLAHKAVGRGSGSIEPPASEPQETPETASSTEEEPRTSGNEERPGEEKSPAGKETKKSSGKKKSSSAAKAAKLTDIEHVFLIVLADEPYAANFAPESKATYLAHTLEKKGELLLRYEAIAHGDLPNGVALLSGQGPTAQTVGNCPSYTPLSPATISSSEQALGDGCIYPAGVQTLPGQLTAKHLAWKAYLQGVEEGPGTPAACPHPAPGAADPSFSAGAYAGYRNPFVYFQSIVASPSCETSDVGLSELSRDLRSAAATPAFSYIVPGRCNDGGPVACSPGAPAGPSDSSELLEKIVPEITSSPAYKAGGLIVITADQAPSEGEYGDSSSCCGQPEYPNYTAPGRQHGGGTVGALLLSPYVKGGTTRSEVYNHYSLLRTVEDIFGLGHIGYAALPGARSFSAELLNEPIKG